MAQAKQTGKTQSQSASSREPIPVIVVEDRDDDNNPPLRLYAVLIFLGTLLGSLIGAVADLGDAAQTVEQFGDIFNPPPQLCIAGSDTILGADLQLGQSWQAEFEQDRRVQVSIDAIGSGAGVRRAIEGGCVNVLAMSEAMTAQQFNNLLGAGVTIECAAEIGYDVIAFVTDISNRVGSLRRNQLYGILRGTITDWSEVRSGGDESIYILARPVADSGTTKHVMVNIIQYQQDFFPGGDDLNNDGIPEQPNYITCTSNEACLDLTLATPGSMYWVSSAWMRTKPPRYLRVVPILRNDDARPINPLTDDFELAEYPSTLARPLYMYVVSRQNTSAADTAVAREFLDYVRSLGGQEVLEEHAFITYFDSTANIPINLPSGFSTSSGVRAICKDSPVDASSS